MLYNMCRKCHKPVKYPNAYCDECLPEAKSFKKENLRINNRRYDHKRDKKYLRFYKSLDWRKLSSAYMQEHSYQCEFKGTRCTKLATEVHHIAPIQTAKGWDKRLDWNNLMCVCVECHNQAHSRFGGR